MIAVLTVFACHLTGWPSGGFVGVDVFFVISGFLITGNLMRTAEKTGTISFWGFYKKRIRRIVPAATLVLIATYLASMLVFLPFRVHQTGVDALFALVFLANWHFAAEGTDYFGVSAESVSPLQHYWSLSIEEQFYFVWPALIFIICVVVVRKNWTHGRRMGVACVVVATIATASFGWAIYETFYSPAAAYFNTFARVWELGVGASLATMAGRLARIHASVRPILSWMGLTVICVSVLLIRESSTLFPAPLAGLPVVGASLVIAAGIGAEPAWQGFLRNPVSAYIGNVSYSLYLVHWPVIIIASAVMEESPQYYVTVVALAFSLSIVSYHAIENPLRRANIAHLRDVRRRIRRHRYWPKKSSQIAAVAALALLFIALFGYATRPVRIPAAPPTITANEASSTAGAEQLRPLGAALQRDIVNALKATEWPVLDPSIEDMVSHTFLPQEVYDCTRLYTAVADPNMCTWGSPTAPIRVVLVGDSIAANYAGSLREIALDSNGQIQLDDEAMPACPFTDDLIDRKPLAKNCAARKQSAIDIINSTKPQVVVIANLYDAGHVLGQSGDLTPAQWADNLHRIIDKIRVSAGKIVLMAPPAGNIDIESCYGRKGNTPADCVSDVSANWRAIAPAQKAMAEEIGSVWIDSRPWFCWGGKKCPSFVDGTPTKWDSAHIAPVYAQRITPVIHESLIQAGVLP